MVPTPRSSPATAAHGADAPGGAFDGQNRGYNSVDELAEAERACGVGGRRRAADAVTPTSFTRLRMCVDRFERRGWW
jgi:hypothetical protein